MQLSKLFYLHTNCWVVDFFFFIDPVLVQLTKMAFLGPKIMRFKPIIFGLIKIIIGQRHQIIN